MLGLFLISGNPAGKALDKPAASVYNKKTKALKGKRYALFTIREPGFGGNRWGRHMYGSSWSCPSELHFRIRMHRFASLPAWPCLRPLRAALGNRRPKQGGTAY